MSSQHFAASSRHEALAWWKFVAREPRRRFGGTGDIASTAAPTRETPYDYGVSLALASRRRSLLRMALRSRRTIHRFESEASYLKRLELLDPGELKRIRPHRFPAGRNSHRGDGDIG